MATSVPALGARKVVFRAVSGVSGVSASIATSARGVRSAGSDLDAREGRCNPVGTETVESTKMPR